MQAAALSSKYSVGRQGTHDVASALGADCAPQLLQAVPSLHLFFWQDSQFTRKPELAVIGCLPALHVAHSVDGSLSWSDLPAAQLTHAVAPALAYAPGLHAPQTLVLMALLARPAGHC